MSEISKLEPRIIWEQFDAITKVPRPSKKEEKIIDFLISFAVAHNLDYSKDKAGNVVIRKPATPTKTGSPTVVLQSHMDMVCEKNSDIIFDFDTEAIKTKIENGWVCAEGTTLGADDGIGMAAAMAVLTDTDIEHGPIEALFTVDEETGLTGAFNLGADMLTGKYLINLDSEDEGEIFIGCAGGVDTIASFDYALEDIPKNHVFFRIDVGGLLGGHSGDDIEKGRANSNKILARFLWQTHLEAAMRLVKFDGGNLRNAIPREAYALFAIPKMHVMRLFGIYEKFSEAVKAEFHTTEPKLEMSISEMPGESNVIDLKTQTALLRSLLGVPNGVLAMSFDIAGLVETSTNLASVKFADDRIVVTSSQRSSVESTKQYAATSVESVYALAGAEVKHSEGYPGWKPDPSSQLLAVSKKCYAELFGKEAKVKAIHAGLECGLFLSKYPHLEMISIGPTLRGVHSPDERLEIVSVDKFWKLLRAILKSL